MGVLGKKLRGLDGGRVAFMCPGCAEFHQVGVGDGPGPRWGYNQDPDAPTFTPSVLVTWSVPSDVDGEFDDVSKDRKKVCHSFVRDGQIEFLGDCTHSLAGKTVDLPDLEEG